MSRAKKFPPGLKDYLLGPDAASIEPSPRAMPRTRKKMTIAVRRDFPVVTITDDKIAFNAIVRKEITAPCMTIVLDRDNCKVIFKPTKQFGYDLVRSLYSMVINSKKIREHLISHGFKGQFRLVKDGKEYVTRERL